jgi:predicted nucleic acid-binding protein
MPTPGPEERLLEILRIGRGGLLLIDTAPLIYLLGEPGRRRSFMEALVAAGRAGSLRLGASVLAWTELLRKPLAAGDHAGAAACRRLLAEEAGLRIYPVDVAVAEEAARLLGLSPRLGLPDAVHLATALVAGAGAILGNDGAWLPALAGNGPRVVFLDEAAAEFEA